MNVSGIQLNTEAPLKEGCMVEQEQTSSSIPPREHFSQILILIRALDFE
jgi:hypothetical protein